MVSGTCLRLVCAMMFVGMRRGISKQAFCAGKKHENIVGAVLLSAVYIARSQA